MLAAFPAGLLLAAAGGSSSFGNGRRSNLPGPLLLALLRGLRGCATRLRAAAGGFWGDPLLSAALCDVLRSQLLELPLLAGPAAFLTQQVLTTHDEGSGGNDDQSEAGNGGGRADAEGGKASAAGLEAWLAALRCCAEMPPDCMLRVASDKLLPGAPQVGGAHSVQVVAIYDMNSAFPLFYSHRQTI